MGPLEEDFRREIDEQDKEGDSTEEWEVGDSNEEYKWPTGPAR